MKETIIEKKIVKSKGKPKHGKKHYKKHGVNYNTLKPNTIGFALKPRQFTKMPYEISSVCTAVGAAGGQTSFSQIWSLNSLFKPDVGSYGKNIKPDGYTLATTMYLDYIVHGALIELDIWQGTVGVAPVNCAIGFSNSNSIFSVGNYASDMGQRVGAKLLKVGNTNSSSGHQKYKKYVRLCDITGETKQQYRDNVYINGSALNASPPSTTLLYLTVGGLPETFGGTPASSVYYEGKITYYVELYNTVFTASAP